MAEFVFTRGQIGIVYGVHFPHAGDVVDLDEGFAADGVAQGLLEPVPVEVEELPEPVEPEPVAEVVIEPPKRGRPRKAE